jgi:hypothetical protein
MHWMRTVLSSLLMLTILVSAGINAGLGALLMDFNDTHHWAVIMTLSGAYFEVNSIARETVA